MAKKIFTDFNLRVATFVKLNQKIRKKIKTNESPVYHFIEVTNRTTVPKEVKVTGCLPDNFLKFMKTDPTNSWNSILNAPPRKSVEEYCQIDSLAKTKKNGVILKCSEIKCKEPHNTDWKICNKGIPLEIRLVVT